MFLDFLAFKTILFFSVHSFFFQHNLEITIDHYLQFDYEQEYYLEHVVLNCMKQFQYSKDLLSQEMSNHQNTRIYPQEAPCQHYHLTGTCNLKHPKWTPVVHLP